MSDRWLQHVQVKFPAGEAGAGTVDLAAAIPVFHRWIQQQALPGLLLDVADYRHVPEGPGVVLVAHEAIYGLDQGGGRLGLLYNRRTRLDAAPPPAGSSPRGSPPTAPTRCASPSAPSPPRGATSASTSAASRATATSATSSGTPRAS